MASGVADTEKPWRIYFEVFKIRSVSEEVARSESLVYFKTMKEIYLKGSDEEIEKSLVGEVVEARIVCELEIGRCAVALGGLKMKKKIVEAMAIDMLGRDLVFLDVVVQLKEVSIRGFKVGEKVAGGACILTVEENTQRN